MIYLNKNMGCVMHFRQVTPYQEGMKGGSGRSNSTLVIGDETPCIGRGTYLSNLFSATEGITIEHYILIHKIERVKELLIYGESNLTEIAYQLRYSSVSHLSNQFKKITGLTPSYFKSLKGQRRNYLETL